MSDKPLPERKLVTFNRYVIVRSPEEIERAKEKRREQKKNYQRQYYARKKVEKLAQESQIKTISA